MALCDRYKEVSLYYYTLWKEWGRDQLWDYELATPSATTEGQRYFVEKVKQVVCVCVCVTHYGAMSQPDTGILVRINLMMGGINQLCSWSQ